MGQQRSRSYTGRHPGGCGVGYRSTGRYSPRPGTNHYRSQAHQGVRSRRSSQGNHLKESSGGRRYRTAGGKGTIVKRRPVAPQTGDITWLTISAQVGHEHSGHRPALVLSPGSYNSKTGWMICCPMTSQLKGYPFEVIVSLNPPSAVLADQIKSLDWRARRASRKGRVSDSVLAEVRAKVRLLIGV